MLAPLADLWCACALSVISCALAHVDSIPTSAAQISVADWTAIRAARDAHRRAAVEQQDGGFAARNPAQSWTTRFDARGFSVEPDHGGWTWGLELERYGFADAERRVTGSIATCASGERVERDWDASLTEWYVNGARGLEHGYTVRERPPRCDEGPLTFTLTVRGELRPELHADGRGVSFVDSHGAAVLSYAGLTVFDAGGRVLDARFELAVEGLALRIDERDARYPLTIDPIAQQVAYLKASNTGAFDSFGLSMSVSGDTAVIGAYEEDSNATGVNGDENNNSAPDAGAAYVFVRSGSTWSQQAYLKASNTEAGDGFGASVSISGDTLVVAALQEDSSATGVDGNQGDNSATRAGAAYVFVRSGTTWSQQAYLKASNTDADDQFGTSVSVSGDTLVVGAFCESSNATGVNGNQGDNSASRAGAAYVFVRSGTTWTQQAYLKASNTDAIDFFGWSVSSSGDTVVVGTEAEDSNATGVNGNQSDNSAPESGAAYVFVRSGTTWTQQAYLKASNTEAGDQLGGLRSVALSGDTLVVGAHGEDSGSTGVNGDENSNSAPESGAAYVFVRSGTTWTQQAYLKASNTDADDQFGYAVSLSGNTIVIGAHAEGSNATGVNGDQSNNSAPGAGAAYVFVRSGTTWSQPAYLKASNTEADDIFGWSLAASGDTAFVGAFRESSNATGVDGNQSDNSASESGAVYVFEIDPPYVNYCSGDGSLATPCPCSPPNTVPNPPAAAGHGCANSLDLDGALLSASGTLSPDTLKFTVDVAPLYSGFAFLVKGNATNASGIAASDGVRCADGALIRFGSHNAGTNGNPSGQWIYPNTAQTIAISAATLQPPAQNAYYQLFYRNAAASFCTSATANWSNGLAVSWP